MNERLVTVFGGTGYLGRHIVDRLIEDGARVRVAVRHPEAAARGERIEAVRADVREEASVAAAVAGAAVVVNAVGLYVQRGGETFDAVHVEGARRVARAATAAGVKRLILISGIGADPRSESVYVRARAAGETAVRAAFPEATILRPSVLFGPGDSFFNSLAGIARVAPFLPLFGQGDTRLQPVFVEDLAEAVARVAKDPAAAPLYELGGARTYTYRGLLKLLLKQLGLKRGLVPVSFFCWESQASLMRLLPRPPITHDMIALMKKDNVANLCLPGFPELGIEAKSVEDILPTYIS